VSLTFHDMFCGAGGSTLGAFMAGATPTVGMNHWQIACDSYEANHSGSGAVSACVDVVTQDPRRYPRADMLLASPECTHHSYARGKPKDDASLFDPAGDMGAERSRATMWDVVRFAEVHAYRICIVENVEAAVKWGLHRGQKLAHGAYGPLFIAWLQAMEALDYRWQVVHLNSMVCGVPQSRDRIYVVFWKRGQRAPDLNITALAWCFRCERLVDAEQRWKRPGATTGTHGQGYGYICPACQAPTALAIRPAAAAIDWSLTAPKIGERKTPLKPATIERIRRGLERLRERPRTLRLDDGLVVQVGANLFEREGYTRAWPLEDVMPTVTGTADRALVLPAGGRSADARPTDQPMHTIVGSDRLAIVLPTTHDDKSQRTRRAADEVLPTITGANRGEQALVLSNMTNNVPRLADDEVAATVTSGGKLAVVVTCRGAAAGADRHATDVDSDPLATITASGNHHGIVVPLRDNNTPKHTGSEPLDTISAQGTHHGLLIANYGSPGGPVSKAGWARHVDDGPVGTVTATDSHGLFCYRAGQDMRHPGEPIATLATVEQHALVGDVTQEEIEGCTFRMLQPDELKLASGFTAAYLLRGTKRDQVCQVGNAVTAPAEAELVRRCITSLS
jgi:DNA (cytosine-5)-methyltransferase 1